MKLLWLNAGLLLPLDKGGKLRTWHIMRHLAAKHDITYLSFADASQTEADRAGMREVCSTLVTIPRTDPGKDTWRFYADAAGYVVDRVPYAVAKYRSDAYRAAFERLIAAERYDAIVCDFLPPVVNMPAFAEATAGKPASAEATAGKPASAEARAGKSPWILFTHNVESEIWRRHAEQATNPMSRFMLTQQWQRMLRFEGAALSRFDLVLAVSEADGRTFARLYPGSLRAPVHVVQTGVDTEYFTPSTAAVDRAHMVFTGSMDWLPNEDGMTYFCREILPRIRQAEPDASLSIIGRSPTPAVRKLAEIPGIEVTGRVDDVRPHIARGSVYIVPLRIGGGTRLKIFEAMSMGKAVVSTTVGAEGLPVTNGRDIEIADEPARFAQAVVRLMREAGARRHIEAAARRLVVEKYDWSAVASDFESALLRVAGEKERQRAIA